MERDFEVVEFGGLRIIKCPGASAQSVSNADFYMTRERYGESWSDYATQVPRFRPAYPSPAEFGDESLDQVLSVAWPNGIPEDIAALLSGSRVAVFDGHGNSYEGIGWGAHIEEIGRA